MAHSARSLEEIKEFIESDDEIEKKAQQCAQQIKNAKHVIFFTGAGISTSTGIPDFRGPEGAWTLAKYGGQRKAPTVSTLKAIPSKSHMAIVELLKRGHAKYLISQNTDGLHRRSGVPPNQISELHGNSNMEVCKKCKKEYLRDGRVRNAKGVFEHDTGRTCDDQKCGGALMDTIINFGENLPEKPLKLAYENAKKADLCISLGSSLTVSPANDMPELVGTKHHLTIVNMQKTPLDHLSDIRVFGKIDNFMERVMKHLSIAIPPFVLTRRARMGPVTAQENAPVGAPKTKFAVRGVDSDGTPFSLFPKVRVNGKEISAQEKDKCLVDLASLPNPCEVKLFFMGNYNEPDLILNVNPRDDKTYIMEFDPLSEKHQWVVKAMVHSVENAEVEQQQQQPQKSNKQPLLVK